MIIQAWGLRRMVSTYNAVVRRPHVPRERGLRRIMISQGLDIPLETPPRVVSSAAGDDDDDGENSDLSDQSSSDGSDDPEDMEEADSTDDEVDASFSSYIGKPLSSHKTLLWCILVF